jgi:hypothetical protein
MLVWRENRMTSEIKPIVAPGYHRIPINPKYHKKSGVGHFSLIVDGWEVHVLNMTSKVFKKETKDTNFEKIWVHIWVRTGSPVDQSNDINWCVICDGRFSDIAYLAEPMLDSFPKPPADIEKEIHEKMRMLR